MRRFAVILALLALTSGCAHLTLAPGGERARLWSQAHDAFARDSFRVAAAAFQRLATDYPHSYEGHEARFYLGVLALEPGSGLDLGAGVQQLGMYVAEDSASRPRGYHLREARALIDLIGDLRRPCAERAVTALRCDAATAAVTRPGEATPVAPEAAAAGAEAARLRREVAARDETIRQLQAELERIRNTLAPRRTPR